MRTVMTPEEIRPLLTQSLDDLMLSRGEKQALNLVFETLKHSQQNWAMLRREIFDAARAKMTELNSQLVVNWLEELMKLLQSHQAPAAERLAPEAHFSPGNDEACPRRIIQLIHGTRTDLEICVFTITDDRLTQAILDAHGRGVDVRIITDNEKAADPGSDVTRFQEAGVPLKVDHTPFHMHHKFAIFDKQLVLTGSYNWTRGAARDNHENFIITSETRLVERFLEVFERLWNEL
jgi:cardiolipin hydrolase